MVIVPAILVSNNEQLHDALFSIEGASSRVQIDLCDGIMGLEKTWLPYKETHLPHGFQYEFDLMVKDWKKYLPRVIALGATRVVVHIDSFTEGDVEDLLSMVQHTQISLGLAVSNSVSIDRFISDVAYIAEHHRKTFVQVMGIRRVGAQGQPFDATSIDRVMHIRFALRSIPIQVDGAMNPETLTKVRRAGADTAVIGSYIFGSPHPVKTIQELESEWG
ncbi:MAG: hypothetical protein RLZZ308_39 [Candidatus Parcubacteria bacterium]|jgi:ribulose-phosphate 3-epimerase